MLPNIGLGELTVIVLVALLVFGPKRLPEMMRAAGKAIGKFQRESQSAMQELRDATNFTGDLGAPPNLGVFDAPDVPASEVVPQAGDPAVPVPGSVPSTTARPRGPRPTAKKPAAKAKKAASSRSTRPASTRPASTPRAVDEPFEDT